MRCTISESHKSMISHVLERVIQSIKVSIESLKKNKQNSRSFPILDLSGTKIRHVASDIIGDFRLRTTGVTSNNSTNSGRRIRSDRLQSIGRISWNTNGALKVIKLLGKPVVNCGVIDTRARVHLAFECALRSFMRDWRLFISSADLLRLDRNSTRSERRRRERALPPSTSEISLMKTECVYVYIYLLLILFSVKKRKYFIV